jgi:hypothetical protein
MVKFYRAFLRSTIAATHIVCMFLFLFAPAHPLGAEEESDAALTASYRNILSTSPVRCTSLGREERKMLYDWVARHKVAGLSELKRYDPKNIMGFCYGRAMAVNLAARRMGLSPESIRKIFAIGRLGTGAVTEWRWHVATLVMGDDGLWYAMEFNLAHEPCNVDEWIEKVHTQKDPGRKAKFYSTSPDAITPDLRIFPAINLETGGRIIELSFNPDGRVGIIREKSTKAGKYRVYDSVLKDYLAIITIGEGKSFDFTKVTVNGIDYSSNNYFDDLLNSITTAPQELLPPPAGTETK